MHELDASKRHIVNIVAQKELDIMTANVRIFNELDFGDVLEDLKHLIYNEIPNLYREEILSYTKTVFDQMISRLLQSDLLTLNAYRNCYRFYQSQIKDYSLLDSQYYRRTKFILRLLACIDKQGNLESVLEVTAPEYIVQVVKDIENMVAEIKNPKYKKTWLERVRKYTNQHGTENFDTTINAKKIEWVGELFELLGYSFEEGDADVYSYTFKDIEDKTTNEFGNK